MEQMLLVYISDGTINWHSHIWQQIKIVVTILNVYTTVFQIVIYILIAEELVKM